MNVEIGAHPLRKIRHTVVDREQSLGHEMPTKAYRDILKMKEHEQVPGRSSEVKDAVIAVKRDTTARSSRQASRPVRDSKRLWAFLMWSTIIILSNSLTRDNATNVSPEHFSDL